MKDYKSEKIYLGSSDMAVLTVVGCTTDGVRAEILKMGGDGDYHAYVIRDWDGLLPSHYSTVMKFRCYTQMYHADGCRGSIENHGTWVKIFDDSGNVTKFEAKQISILRAGEFGILIHLEN